MLKMLGFLAAWSGPFLVCSALVCMTACADLPDTEKVSQETVRAVVTVAFPDGSDTRIDLTHGSLNGAMEFDPDDRPEMRQMVLGFETTPDEGVDCRIDLTVSGYCGPGAYPLGVSSTATATLFDCPGVPDDYESVFNLNGGAVEILRLSVDAERGATQGETHPVQIEGGLVHTSDDFHLAAAFLVDSRVDGRDAEEQDCAEFIPLDGTEDGSGSGGSGSGGSGSGGSGSGGSGSGGSGSGGSGSGGGLDSELVQSGIIFCQPGSSTSEESLFVELALSTSEVESIFTVTSPRDSFDGICDGSNRTCFATAPISTLSVASCADAAGLDWTAGVQASGSSEIEFESLEWLY